MMNHNSIKCFSNCIFEILKYFFEKMEKFRCKICGYVYNPESGDPVFGIKEGTPFKNLPADWTCPVCSVNTDDFEPID